MPWVRGTSGNPLGRTPDRYTIKSILKKIGNQIVDTSVGKMRKAELMWTAVYNEAIKGDVRAAYLIAERLEGKAPQFVNANVATNNVQLIVRDQDQKAIVERIIRHAEFNPAIPADAPDDMGDDDLVDDGELEEHNTRETEAVVVDTVPGESSQPQTDTQP